MSAMSQEVKTTKRNKFYKDLISQHLCFQGMHKNIFCNVNIFKESENVETVKKVDNISATLHFFLGIMILVGGRVGLIKQTRGIRLQTEILHEC